MIILSVYLTNNTLRHYTRLLYGGGVPLGHIGTGVANIAIQCQYDLEVHLDNIITFLLPPST